MNQNIVFISQHAVRQLIVDILRVMLRVVSPPDFLDMTGSSISPLHLDTRGLLLQQLSLDNFSLFLICSCSLCNLSTRFVCWEKRVERIQVKSSQ